MSEFNRFFIIKGKVRWVKKFIRMNVEFDYKTTHLVVSMDNSLNNPTGPNDCLIESINVKDFFNTKREAQLELIIRERFN